ncbi:hypothetical protein P8452_33598 [Trifolium repens]|nr:hypothetical protein P8452_33598 [Trifolium repens]
MNLSNVCSSSFKKHSSTRKVSLTTSSSRAGKYTVHNAFDLENNLIAFWDAQTHNCPKIFTASSYMNI